MNSDSLKTRSFLFDNIKAILIISVITAHFMRVGGSFSASSFGGVVYIISFSYIMQAFIFVSGYFSKNVQKCRDNAVKNFLVPYILLMPIMFAVRYLLFGHAKLDLMMPTFALWFMLVMFVYRFSIKTLSKIPAIIPISLLCMLISGCIPALGIKLSLGRIFSFLFFFVLGYKCEETHIERIRQIPKKYTIILLILLIGYSVAFSWTAVLNVDLLQMKDCYALFGLSNIEGILVRSILTVIAMAWIIVFISLSTDKQTFLSKVGRNTMAVYVFHIPVRYIIKSTGVIGSGNVLYYAIIIGLSALSVYVFSRPVFSKIYNTSLEFVYDKLILGFIGLFRKNKTV